MRFRRHRALCSFTLATGTAVLAAACSVPDAVHVSTVSNLSVQGGGKWAGGGGQWASGGSQWSGGGARWGGGSGFWAGGSGKWAGGGGKWGGGSGQWSGGSGFWAGAGAPATGGSWWAGGGAKWAGGGARWGGGGGLWTGGYANTLPFLGWSYGRQWQFRGVPKAGYAPSLPPVISGTKDTTACAGTGVVRLGGFAYPIDVDGWGSQIALGYHSKLCLPSPSDAGLTMNPTVGDSSLTQMGGYALKTDLSNSANDAAAVKTMVGFGDANVATQYGGALCASIGSLAAAKRSCGVGIAFTDPNTNVAGGLSQRGASVSAAQSGTYSYNTPFGRAEGHSLYGAADSDMESYASQVLRKHNTKTVPTSPKDIDSWNNANTGAFSYTGSDFTPVAMTTSANASKLTADATNSLVSPLNMIPVDTVLGTDMQKSVPATTGSLYALSLHSLAFHQSPLYGSGGGRWFFNGGDDTVPLMDLSSIFQGSMNIVTGQLAGTADKNPTLSNAYISPLSLRYADWHAEPTTGTLYVTRAGQTPSTVSTDDGALRLQRPLSNLGAGNFATCALASAGGGVKCWGDNSFGTLGDGSTVAASATPVQVSGLTAGVASTTGGFAHHCALTTAGAVQCWGNNAHGELGATLAAGATVSSVPVQVAGLTSGVVAIAAGGHGAWGNGSDGSFTCALTTAGGVKCWGLNDYGQLGRGSSTGIGDYSATPADVTGLTSGVVAIAAGYRHACAVMATGRVKCWGDGEFGQTGDTTACDAWTDDRFSPVDVLGLNDALSIDAGNDHTCALTRTGVVKCWGDNGYGQVGNGAMGANVCGPSTAGVNLGSSAVSLSVGGQFTCAVLSGGTVKCWGRNHWGQLGDGTTTNRVAPVSVTGLTGVTAVESGDTHNCARLSAGNVKCWGSNAYGEIAQATGTMAMAPVDVASTVNNTGLIASQGSVLVARFTSDSTVVGGHVMPIPYSMTDTTGKQALVVTFDPLAVAAANFIEQYDAHIAACNATTSESMTETDQSSGKKLWACSNAAAKADYLAGMLDFVKGARHYLFGYDDGCIYDGTTCTTTKVDYANAHLPYTVWVPDYATFATYYTSVSDAVTAYNTSILGATATRLEKTLQMVNVAHFNTNQAIVTSTVTRSGAYGATCVNNDGFSTKLK